MRFTVIDLETANARMRSICQLGMVVFEGGVEVAAHSMLVDPEDYFDGINISIHGIDESHVVGAKTFPQLHGWISESVQDAIVVHHTHFDRVALAQACKHHEVDELTCRWLDSAKVARRAWPQYARRGYGLSNLAQDFDIVFQHHDALEDARATGLVLLRAMAETGLDLDAWLHRIRQPIFPYGSAALSREPAEEGRFSGHSVVFTGSLEIVRGEAAQLALAAGMAVQDGVTKLTTLLVVGDQDVARFNGNEKSRKHRKAEAMIADGYPIRIIQESDFMALVEEAI